MGLANFFVWADLKTQSLQSLPHKWLGLQAWVTMLSSLKFYFFTFFFLACIC
jgi:hypothetical protein